MGTRLGADLTAIEKGHVMVVESPRRLGAEQSYGYVHGLWWLWLADGRSVLSVPPGARAGVTQVLQDVHSSVALLDGVVVAQLREHVDTAMEAAGLPHVSRVLYDQVHACDWERLRPHTLPNCHQIHDDAIRPAAGLRLPRHCFPDGVVYGVVADGQIAAVAYAHRAGVMEGVVADIGVETATAYRGRGYAKAAVSALVWHYTERGGEAKYSCNPENVASMATARSVGFAPYARSLVLSVPLAGEP